MAVVQVSLEFPLIGYLLLFTVAAVACFAGALRTRLIRDGDTRRGLVSLLLLSGVWALSHVAYLAVPTPQFKYWFFVAGLIVGIATVGPWLYFCSAYTGRLLHRTPSLRRGAVALYLLIVAIKVSNPFHNLYFTAEFVTEPFPLLLINHGPLHWVVMGLAYALAFVGIFILFEFFTQVSHNTKPLIVLVSLTGIPVVLDVFGAVTPYLLDLTYSSLGVAVFAFGVSYFYLEDFQTIQLTGTSDHPVIVLDAEHRIRDSNGPARDLFPALIGSIGEPGETVVPEIADRSVTKDGVVEVTRNGELRYYDVSRNSFTADTSQLGQLVTLTDVTPRERYRQQLEQQNSRLAQFASIVSHDLRNPLNVAQGRVDLAMEDGDPEHLVTANSALDRMEALIDDLLTLARSGQDIDASERVDVAALVQESWRAVETGEAALVVADGFDHTIDADRNRLQQLCENLIRNAIEHGGHGVTVTVGELTDDLGFYFEDDGVGLPEGAHEKLFDSGFTTSEDGTGFGLAIVSEIAEAHGWSIHATNGSGGGARFEIRVHAEE